MRNKILFEFEDLVWFPEVIRRGMTDYLRYIFTLTGFYSPAVPLINEALRQSREKRVVDLCSGSGGPWPQLSGQVIEKVILTDLFPNVAAFKYISEGSAGRIGFDQNKVNATEVPGDLPGLRTIFSGIHHFSTAGVKAILSDAVRKKQPIAIFDGADRSPFTMLAIAVLHPVGFTLLTPFFKPFRWSRILFTYLLPVIPACTVWDGLVSILRLHDPAKLLNIAREVSGDTYHWDAGKMRNRYGFRIGYLVGYPVRTETTNN